MARDTIEIEARADPRFSGFACYAVRLSDCVKTIPVVGRQIQNKGGALGLCDDGSIVSGRWKDDATRSCTVRRRMDNQ